MNAAPLCSGSAGGRRATLLQSLDYRIGVQRARVRRRRLLRLRRLDCLRLVLRRVQIAVDSKSLGFIMYS